MDASGRELRASLQGTPKDNTNTLIVIGFVVAIAFICGLVFLGMKMMNSSDPMTYADNAAQPSAERGFGSLSPVSSDLGPNGQSQNAKAAAELNAALRNTPQGRMVMNHNEKLLKSDRVQETKKYHSTVGTLQSCVYAMNNDARMRTVLAAYEKRNKSALESWTARDKSMMDRAARGEVSELELGLWAIQGGAQNAALDNMMAFGSISSMSGEGPSSSECSKVASQAQRKDLDIQGRPQR